jgi:serine phosphatase RsbU (regulator of sigma subunit)
MKIKFYNKTLYFLKLFLLFILLFIFFTNSGAQESGSESLEIQAKEYLNQGDNSKALEFFNKAVYSYWKSNKFEKAVSCFESASDICRQANNNTGLYHANGNIAILYAMMEDHSKALTYFLKTLEIGRKLGNRTELSSNIYNVGVTLQNLNRFKESLDYLTEASKLAQEAGDLKLLLQCYSHIAAAYEKTGVSDKAFEFYEKFEALDHKLKHDEMNDVKSEADQKVNVATAEKQATELKLDQTSTTLRQTADSLTVTQQLAKARQMENELISSKLKYEKKIRRVQSWTLSVISLLLVTLIFMFRQKLKDNFLLKQKNVEIEKQKEEISIQNIKLERQNTNIRDSITYAQNIQSAILPRLESIQKYFECFVVYLPKDIVSGDFYWFVPLNTDTDNWKNLLAVVDCTGHGVPGAFMSLIGNRLLSEIVNIKNISDPSEILTQLNQNLYLALKQETTENEDGMDVCLCMIEKSGNNYSVDYAGAKRPLIYYSTKTGELITLTADRQSLGGHKNKYSSLSFKVQHIELQKGDILFLSSDDLIDQNGPDHKRFGTPKLLEVLKYNALEPMHKQKENLMKEYYKFLASEEQRDDITLIGVKLI